MADLPETARTMHERMVEDGKPSYSQTDIMKMMDMATVEEMMNSAQELLNRGLLKLLESQKDGKDKKVIMFAPISEQEAQKVSEMTNDEAMIYNNIAAAGREGIWTKTLKSKTNLHQHVVLRCLKSLESQSYIKSVKSVKHPQRKIYMLYHLTPSIEVTGGPWFTDSELDVAFINSLLSVVWRLVAEKTFPQVFKRKGVIRNAKKQYSYPAEMLRGMGGQLPTLAQIEQHISHSGVTTVELTKTDVQSLCSVLVYDEKIEVVGGNCYRATWQSVLEAGNGIEQGVDVYSPQNTELFNIEDAYRTMDAVTGEAEGSEGDAQQRFYLDSWCRI